MVGIDNVHICNTDGTGFEGVKVSRRTAEAQHCERPCKAFGESAISVAIDGPGLKGGHA